MFLLIYKSQGCKPLWDFFLEKVRESAQPNYSSYKNPAVMKNMTEVMNILRNYKQKMSSYYGILRLGIFGSVARGEQTEDSDLDVFVELQIPNPYILGDIKEDLEHMTGYKIDLIRLCDNLNKLLLQNIERDGIFA